MPKTPSPARSVGISAETYRQHKEIIANMGKNTTPAQRLAKYLRMHTNPSPKLVAELKAKITKVSV